jgi:hypothetical protein
MVFRVSHAADVVEAEVLGGVLRLELSATGLALQLPDRQLVLTGRELTLAYGRGGGRRDRKASFPLPGQLWIARDAPREDVGIWIAEDLGATRVRRVLGIEPRSLLEPGGLEALRALDRLTARLRQALADQLGASPRAVEMGSGFGKILVVEADDYLEIFGRGLFGMATRRVLLVHRDGRVIIGDGTTATCEVRSRFGVTVLGDYIRFAAPSGLDLARAAVPWIAPEARLDLARRVGEMLDAGLA